MAVPLEYARYSPPPRVWPSWLLAGSLVLLVGGLIAGAVARGSVRTPSKATMTWHCLQDVSAALEAFSRDVGRLPTAAEGLAALTSRPHGLDTWAGPYIPPFDHFQKDAFGGSILYQAPAEPDGVARVVSGGADGAFGTPDDQLVSVRRSNFIRRPPATAASAPR
jgi:general secretion pathway protein G